MQKMSSYIYEEILKTTARTSKQPQKQPQNQSPTSAELLDDLDKISLKQAALVGAFQLLSLWPGFSRSGSTLAGGLLVGLKRETAANYTFLIAVPLMFVACLYDLI